MWSGGSDRPSRHAVCRCSIVVSIPACHVGELGLILGISVIQCFFGVISNAIDWLIFLWTVLDGQIILGTSSDVFISIWGCILKGCFERGIFYKAKSHLKGIEDFNLEHLGPWSQKPNGIESANMMVQTGWFSRVTECGNLHDIEIDFDLLVQSFMQYAMPGVFFRHNGSIP